MNMTFANDFANLSAEDELHHLAMIAANEGALPPDAPAPEETSIEGITFEPVPAKVAYKRTAGKYRMLASIHAEISAKAVKA